MKEDDPNTAMVCMTGTRRGKRSARITVRGSNPMEGEESDNASEGHETLVIDEETPLIGKNTGGLDSPILSGIDDDVSLATQSLGSSFSTH